MAPFVEFRRGLRVAGHPLHVELVHFPLTFWTFVLPLEFLGWWLDWEWGWRLAFWANALALILAIPTLSTGLWDWTGLKDPASSATGAWHLGVMFSTAAVFALQILVRGGSHPPGGGWRGFTAMGLSFFGLSLLTWGTWLGGEMVFRHGVGRREGGS